MESVVHQWARAQAVIRAARDAALMAEGLTWDKLKEMEQDALRKMGDAEYLDTEFGRVQRRPEGPVSWVAKRSAEMGKPVERLTLLTKKEGE